VGAGPDGSPNGIPPNADTFRHAINPSVRQEAVNGPGVPSVFPDLVRYPPFCNPPANTIPRPCPEAISADDPGMLVVNYRNEPVGLRVYDPFAIGPDGNPGTQAAGLAGDLAFALQTRTDRVFDFDPPNPIVNLRPLNVQPTALTSLDPFGTGTPTTFPPPINSLGLEGAQPGDPFTPMMRVQQGDIVKVKVQAGGHEHEHNATIHGVKWTQGNSGHGDERPAAGWRNAQNPGISEQFNFIMPVDADPGGENQEDHAYSVDASQDGWWSGMWGIIRSYQTAPADLYPIGPKGLQVNNRDAFIGACPDVNEDGTPENLREYRVVAITANELLADFTVPTNPVAPLGITIVPGDASANMHVGGPLLGNGTLVYNPRGGTGATSIAQFQGPLHDPTALLYVRVEDLEPIDPNLRACEDQEPRGNRPGRPGVTRVGCPVQLKSNPNAPLEPLVLRANAGDCIQVTLFNRLPEVVPDLAGYNTLLQMVIRDRDHPMGPTTFQNNLIRPSSYAGLHPQLVEYDINKGDGTVVGLNPADQIAQPDSQVVYHWYAGHLSKEIAPCVGPGGGPKGNKQCVDLVPTAVEFGGSNLIPADKIKQGQKGMVGALVIEPVDATWPEDDRTGATDLLALGLEDVRDRQQANPAVNRKTRADLTVSSDSGDFEDLVVVIQKGQNLRYKLGEAVENIAGEGGAIPEDSHDAGQKGINYGTEPAWFRFGLAANAPFGNPGLGGQANAWELYSNALAGNEDPATPVFTTTAGVPARLRVLEPTGVGRGTTFTIHGHAWQRAPYLQNEGDPTDPDDDFMSQTIGLNPIGFYLGGQESVTPYAHFDVVLDSAGGENAVTGDYLFRDQASFGNTDGIWGIMRVQ
jgi:hypothetical protein